MDLITANLIALLVASLTVYGFFALIKHYRDAEQESNDLSGAVLAALREGEKHSYELVKWFKANQPELLKAKSDSPLFTVLQGLEDQGYIKSRTETDPTNNRLRRFYSLKRDSE